MSKGHRDAAGVVRGDAAVGEERALHLAKVAAGRAPLWVCLGVEDVVVQRVAFGIIKDEVQVFEQFREAV